MEALFRVMWNAFIAWKQSNEQTKEEDENEEEMILEKFKLCRVAVENKFNIPEACR